MMINPTARTGAFQEGDDVLYVPNHADGDRRHPDCERGTVTSFNEANVFVRYAGRSRSQATSPEDLTNLSRPDEDDSLPLAGTVLVRAAKQYGMDTFLPDNKLAHALAELAGTKTVTPMLIIRAKRMGFTVHTTGESPRRL